MMTLEKKRTLPKKSHVGALAGSLGLPQEAWASPSQDAEGCFRGCPG